MAKRQVVRVPKRKLCVGDLNREVRIVDRQLGVPTADAEGVLDPNFTENFGVDQDLQIWVGIKTLNGKELFLGTGTDRITLTHEILLYFDPDITTESWVIMRDGRLLDIKKVEDFEEQGVYMKLSCVERGLGEGAKA
jgi:SPP1 family predicted phage head-tail adaptor